MKNRSPLFVIFLVVFIDLVGFGIVIPILPYYAKTFGASATELGWLMTVYSALQFFFAPVWGRLSDRIGRRPVLMFTMAGTAASMVFLGFAHSLRWLFVGRALAGLCGANISTASAYIVDVTTEENRAKGMGIIGAGFGLGFIFGPAIGGVLSRFGYDVPMFFAAGLSLINIAFAVSRLTEPEATRALREKNRTKRFDVGAWRESFGDKRTRLAILLFFVVTLAATQMEVTFALFMQKRYTYDAQGAGWLLAFMGIIMVAMQGGLIGKLSRRFGERTLILFGTAAMAIALVLLAKALTVPVVMGALALLAIGSGVTNPSLSAMASKGAKRESRGATMGVYQSAGSLARVLGPPMAGYLYDTRGIASPFLTAAVMLVFACAGLGFFSKAQWALQATRTWRAQGFKGLLRAYGWKLVVALFAYYLVRDITLYIALPYLAAKGLFSL